MVSLEGVALPLLLVKQVFTNEDGSTGIQCLVISDTTLDGERIAPIYQKRWNVESYRQSLKQNATEKSPAHTVIAQTNHFFVALCSGIKLDYSQAIPGSISLLSSPNCIYVPFNLLLPLYRELKPVELVA